MKHSAVSKDFVWEVSIMFKSMGFRDNSFHLKTQNKCEGLMFKEKSCPWIIPLHKDTPQTMF